MSYKFPVKMHTKVHKATLQEESSIDWDAIDEKNRREAEMKAAMENADHLWKEQARINKEREMSNAYVGADILMKTKLSCLESLHKDVPDMIVSEAFAHLYIDTCRQILDEDYVLENLEAFRNMAYMYIRKLGGMEYLKAQCESANASPYLRKMYNICMEAAKKATADKGKDIMNAMSEDEARDILNGAVKVKDKNELLDKIDSLGTDQLAELIRNKVVDVVRDEQLKEKDEREQRTILKNDLISGEPISDTSEGKDEDDDKDSDAGEDDVDFDEDDDKKSSKKKDKKKGKKKDKDEEEPEEDDESSDDDSDKDEKKSKKKGKKKDKDEDSDSEDEEPKEDEDLGDLGDEDEDKGKKKDKKKKAAKESFGISDISNWNPLTESFDYNKDLTPRSLFYAINVSVMRDMVESAATTEGASITAVRRKAPEIVLENPLNMDIFMEYLKDNSDGYDVIEKSETHEPAILGSSAPMVDYDKVLTESLVQYTLLECAHTIKLINVTPEMIRQQSDYLLGI